MAKKKATEGITLSEFRAWLQGVEEMQGPDWAPSVEQWKRIKSKFMDIVEEDTTTATVAATPGPYRPALPQPFQQFAAGTMPAPTEYPQSRPQPLPQGMSGIDGRVRTPDIDSSGGYVSDLV